jgi:hypothetical protein
MGIAANSGDGGVEEVVVDFGPRQRAVSDWRVLPSRQPGSGRLASGGKPEFTASGGPGSERK